LRSLAINTVADSLVASGDVYASDNDPELVRQALPFALKTMESLLAEQPENRKLLLAACRGFAQYSYAFVDTNADRLESVDYRASLVERERALKLYLRARDYCLRSLELESAGIGRQLEIAPETALAEFGVDEVPVLFWTGAAWGGAISLGKDRPELSADLPAVRALMERTLELDPDYDLGAAHSVMIVLEALPAAMGGSRERARDHFEQAVTLSRGLSAGPYVTLAKQVSVPAQDWREFQQLLEQALDIDPDREPSLRLVNIIAQDRARTLLAEIEELFLDYPGEPSEESQ
jgi:predicted anti-sigma-YlaC factor YlaD